jgi:hypothetical protein
MLGYRDPHTKEEWAQMSEPGTIDRVMRINELLEGTGQIDHPGFMMPPEPSLGFLVVDKIGSGALDKYLIPIETAIRHRRKYLRSLDAQPETHPDTRSKPLTEDGEESSFN